MSDFERSGMTVDEPAKRRSPGNWFADMGDRLARGFNSFDRPQTDESDWEPYDEPDQPTAAVEAMHWEPDHKRFPTAMHGYDRDAVDEHLAALEQEIDELRARRLPPPTVEQEIERVGEETTAILKVAHEQASEITRRAQTQADKCVADAAANAVAMTEDAKRKLRQLDSETDAVWAERGRLIEDVRNVATALFSLAEDAADRFPEDGDRGGATVAMAGLQAPAPQASAPSHASPVPASPPQASMPRPVSASGIASASAMVSAPGMDARRNGIVAGPDSASGFAERPGPPRSHPVDAAVGGPSPAHPAAPPPDSETR
jgi:DivIVA domain-containing protein